MSTSGPNPTSGLTPISTGPDHPHAEPDDREEVYFQGSPPLRALAGKVFLFGLLAVALLALAILLIHTHTGPWSLKLGTIVVALLVPLIPWIISKRVRYRISNYRIDYERGLLAKTIDTLELWHVEDLHFHQSILERILGVGSIHVISHDESMPNLCLFGIPNPRPIYETLKQRVIAVKRQRGVIKMDPG
jgi:membrane protein YdbS with pleckstrin-like domain